MNLFYSIIKGWLGIDLAPKKPLTSCHLPDERLSEFDPVTQETLDKMQRLKDGESCDSVGGRVKSPSNDSATNKDELSVEPPKTPNTPNEQTHSRAI